MIDRVKLTFTYKEFNSLGGNFEKCKKIVNKALIDDSEENGKLKIITEYYLPNQINDHRFKIDIDEWFRIHIYGSLRKWLYGEASLKDLTNKDFLLSVKKLARYLNLPFEDLLKHEGLTGVEIGYNFHSEVSCEYIISHIYRYGRILETKNYDCRNETLYGNGSDKKIKIYNKTKEIWDTQGIKVENNWIRIEVEMKDSDAFKRYKLGKLKSLAEIDREWTKLQIFFLIEISRMKFITRIITDKLRSPKKKEMGKYLNKYGFLKGMKKYEIKFQLKEGSSERDFLNLMAKFPSYEEYNHSKLKRDFAKRFFLINNMDKHIPLNFIAHLLWGTNLSSKLRKALYNKGGISA